MKILVYRVCKWQTVFENNRTKELKKLSWVPMPNKHDSDGYCEILDHPNGMAHYAAWVLIAQVASKCGEVAPGCGGRGTLLRSGARPYDAAGLARVTHGKEETFSEAIPRLVKVGWLELVWLEVTENPTLAEMSQVSAEIPQAGATLPQEGAASRARAGASLPFPSIPFSSVPGSEEGARCNAAVTPCNGASETVTPSGNGEAENWAPMNGRGAPIAKPFEQVKSELMTIGIPDEFIHWVYDDWATRQWKDGGGVQVEITGYVKKRWTRESTEWKAGTHKGNSKNGTNPKSSAKGFDRNAGTLNDPSRYDLAEIEKRRALQKSQSIPATNGGPPAPV